MMKIPDIITSTTIQRGEEIYSSKLEVNGKTIYDIRGINEYSSNVLDDYEYNEGEMKMEILEDTTELKCRELAEGETLESVPVSEVTDEVEEEPMNIMEQHALLLQEKESNKNKSEDDKLYDSISAMTDEELKAAIAEEDTDLKEGDGTNTAPEGFDHSADARAINSMMLHEISDQHAMEIYNIAVKAKADPSYNVIADLPKPIYDNIVSNCRLMNVRSAKAINNYSRMLVLALLEEMSLDKECQAFQDELGKAMAFPEIVDMYSEHTRNQMEVELLANAELVNDDPVLKAELIAVSQAFTDSYTFVRQLELLKDDAFVRKLEKKVKRYERYCTDFDFIMSRSVLRTAPIKSLLNEIPHILKVNENTCKAFIVLLMEVGKNIKPDDKPGIWFLYNSMRNIISLARTGDNKTEFAKEGIGYLKVLFNTLEKRHTEVYSV